MSKNLSELSGFEFKEDEMELSNLKEQIDEDQEYIDTNKITKRDKKTHQRNIKQYKMMTTLIG